MSATPKYAVLDVDRDTILTARETVTEDAGTMEIVVAQPGQNLFACRDQARLFADLHYDMDGFGPHLKVIQVNE